MTRVPRCRPAVEALEDRRVLSAGTTIASALTHSPEAYTDFVTSCYQRYLGRAPDAAGLAGWVGVLEHGLTDERLEASFIGSPEYIADHGGAGAGWVTGMYQNLLGRTPAAAEVGAWVAVLASGATTADVAYGFAASAEREGNVVRSDYATYLGRPPSAAEVAAWVNVFLAGARNEDVVAGFLGSPENMAHYPALTDWLAGAYKGVLNRTPSPADSRAWLGAAPGTTFNLPSDGIFHGAAVSTDPTTPEDLYQIDAQGDLIESPAGGPWAVVFFGPIKEAGGTATAAGYQLGVLWGSQYEVRTGAGAFTVPNLADNFVAAAAMTDGGPSLSLDPIGQTVQADGSYGAIATGERTTPDGHYQLAQFSNGVVVSAVATGQVWSATGSTAGADQTAANDLSDASLSDEVLADLVRDGTLTRADMIAFFRAAESPTGLTAAQVASLQRVAWYQGDYHTANSAVGELSYQLVSGPHTFGGVDVGAVAAGMTGGTLEKLVGKWFFGTDHPAADAGVSYSAVPGTLFHGTGPTYQDIKQGYNGDCYLESAMALVAYRTPAAIRDIFTDNGDGTWTVELFDSYVDTSGNRIQGYAHWVTVDNMLPGGGTYYDSVRPDDLGPGDPNVLWVALLEKAFAQFNEEDSMNLPLLTDANGNPLPDRNGKNTFAAIAAGYGSDAYQALTNWVMDTYTTGDDLAYDYDSYGIGVGFAATEGVGNGLLNSLVGVAVPGTNYHVVGSHCYAVLDWNPQTDVFTVFNPWGINGGTENGVHYDGLLYLTSAQIAAPVFVGGQYDF